MRRILALLGILLAWPALAPAETPPAAETTIALALRDGTHVHGRTRLDALALVCPYGQLNVPLADVRRIVVEQLSAKGETWQQTRLEMNNGDRLTGRPKLANLDIETPYGPLSVPLADVVTADLSAPGLVLYYPFDEKGDQVIDKSGHGRHGAVHGATWTPNGKAGGAYDFNGKSDYIELGPSNLFKSQGQLSAAAWVYIRNNVAIVLSNYHGGGAYNGQFFFTCDDVGGLDVLLGQGPNTYLRYISKPRAISRNQWHHVAFSYDETRGNGNKIKLYIDGEEQGGCTIQSEGNGGPVLDIAENLRIMAHRDTPTGTLSDGLIDDVMIFDQALSAAEVRQIRGGDRTGPVLHLAFDTDEGAKVSDSSGKGNHGSVAGAKYTRQGKNGGGYCLSGTNEHITIPNSDSLEIRDQVTLAVWVNLASLGPGGYGNEHGYIINKGDDLWWNPAFCLGYAKSGEPLFHVGNATDPQRGGGKTALGETKIVPGRWVHLAGVYDGATVKLYVNGHLEREEKYSGPIRSDRAPVHLGGGKLFGVDWGNHFTVHGTIDEVMIFDRALSAAEINQIVSPSPARPRG